MSYLSKFWASFVFLTIVISALFDSAPSKADIIAVFDENEAAFVEAAESGDFSELEQLRDIQEVKLRDNSVDIFFGGYGFASATSYYGIFYSADGSIDAHAFAPSKNNFVRNGSGWLYKERYGDNSFYCEPLGHDFFYYEAHFCPAPLYDHIKRLPYDCGSRFFRRTVKTSQRSAN